MKNYDYKKAKEIIKKHENEITSAALGMYEDWFWTAETVYEDGEFTTELNEDTKIGGINESSWATPTLQLCFKDGTEKMIEISAGQNDNEKPSWFQLGVLSQPCQDNITPLE